MLKQVQHDKIIKKLTCRVFIRSFYFVPPMRYFAQDGNDKKTFIKKLSTIFLAVFLAIILPLTFLTVKFFLNQNNSGFSKISWEKPEEELKDNLILAPFISPNSAPENYSAKSEKPVEKVAEKSFPVSLAVENHLVSWGFAKSNCRTVDTIIIHSSYDALSGNPYSLEGLIKEYRQYGVSPHYLIDRKGIIYRLVEEKNMAYHA